MNRIEATNGSLSTDRIFLPMKTGEINMDTLDLTRKNDSKSHTPSNDISIEASPVFNIIKPKKTAINYFLAPLFCCFMLIRLYKYV